jgi:GNAT superfamily N-acetyltransferase
VVERSVGLIAFGVYRWRRPWFRAGRNRPATFAYLDVFVLEDHRGRGLSKWLMECLTEHPDVRDLRRWHLVTRDAQGLYAQYGFAEPPPGKHMERLRANPYASAG